MQVLLSRASWEKYVEEELMQLYMALERINRIYDEVSKNSERYRALLLGVIGGKSIGHSRRIMRIMRNLFGVRVSGAREALKLVARGVPLEKAGESVSFDFTSGTSFRGLVTVSMFSLASVIRDLSRGFSEKAGGSDKIVSRDLAALASNPLHLVKILGSVASTSTRVMPLRNPHSLAIVSLSGIPRSVFKRLFGDPEDLSKASRGLIDPQVLAQLRDEDLSIISYKPGSHAEKIAQVIENTYQIHAAIRKTCRHYIHGQDERLLHIAVMTPEARRIARNIGVDLGVERLIVRSARKISEPHPEIAVIKGTAIINPNTCRAVLGEGIETDCNRLLEYLGLKVGLGVGRLSIAGRPERRIRIVWSIAIEQKVLREEAR